MRVYNDDNFKEWSRKLMAKYGPYFRLYSDEKETLERWANRLSFIYGFRFQIHDTEYETLKEWSKLIGG